MEPVHNPFSYGNVYYPNETSNLGEGHYIIFDIIEHRDTQVRLPGGVIYPEAIGTVGETKYNKTKRTQRGRVHQRIFKQIILQGYSNCLPYQNTGNYGKT